MKCPRSTRARSSRVASSASSTSAATGKVTVDGKDRALAAREGLYVPMGTTTLSFSSDSKDAPAKFYLASTPAHARYETVKIDIAKANPMPVGALRDRQRAHHLPVHQSGHLQVGAAAHGPDLAQGRQRVEHHALPPARAPLGNLFLLRPQARRARGAHHGRAARDAAHLRRQRRGGHRAAVVHPHGLRHLQLQLHLGDGRRKPGIQGRRLGAHERAA